MSEKPLDRLLCDPELDEDARVWLEEAERADIDPPAGAKQAVYGAVVATLGAAGGGSLGGSGAGGSGAATGGGAATGAAGGAAGAKATAGILAPILIGSACAGVLAIAYSLFVPSDDDQNPAPPQHSAQIAPTSPVNTIELIPPPSASAPAPAPAPVTSQAAGEQTEPNTNSNELPLNSTETKPENKPGAAAIAPKASGAASSSPETARANQMAEESKQMGEAREALRKGNAAQALMLLDKIQQQFPHSMLYQEREALAIEALYKSGQRAQAQTRAKAFIDRFPSSPLSHRVAAFIK